MNGNHQEQMDPKPLREVAFPKVRDFTDSYYRKLTTIAIGKKK